MYYGYGYGFNHKGDGVIPFDTDAQAFITAASITDPTQQSAVNQLVVDLKAASLWTKMKRIYPMVGGSATQHRIDLKTLATGTFAGGWTHSSTGSLPNGSTGYFDTGFNPSVGGLTAANQHISYYSRTNTAAGNKQEMGVVDVSNASAQLGIIARYTGDAFYPIVGGTSFPNATPVTDSRGLWTASKVTAGKIDGYQNAFKAVNQASQNDALVDDATIYVGALNNQGVTVRYTDRECAFASVGTGLTATDVSNLYTAVQTFQTTLSRNV